MKNWILSVLTVFLAFCYAAHSGDLFGFDLSPEERKMKIEEYLDIARKNISEENSVVALDALISAEKLGSAKAQAQLYALYINGHGDIAKNQQLAEQYLEKAAISGYREAQFQLGINYSMELNGYKEDKEEGFKWGLLAAEQDYPPAQWFVATAYRRGIGVAENRSKYLEWIIRSADNGFADAQFEYANLIIAIAVENESDDSRKIEHLKLAAEYLSSAADQGHEKAKRAIEEMKKFLEID